MDTTLTSSYHLPPTWTGWLGFICALLTLGWANDGLKAFLRGARKSPPKEEAPVPETPTPEDDWDALRARASRVIEEIIAQLPSDVAVEAKQVPYLFKEHDVDASPGYRTLGRYHNFIPGHKSEYKGPIFLFLKTIQDVCAENGEDFDTVIKTTYLHELGHHFGWDEVDLVRHGLPSGRPPSG